VACGVPSKEKLKKRLGNSALVFALMAGGKPDGPANNTAQSVRQHLKRLHSSREFPMRQFLKNLFRDLRTTKTRPERRTPRTSLKLEGLEDRLVPAHLISTPPLVDQSLTISPAPSQMILFKAIGGGQAEEYNYSTGRSFDYTIASFNSVNIELQGNNIVHIDDSNGMPFSPGATIGLTGTGELLLYGSHIIQGNELYVAGGAPWTSGEIVMDSLNVTFNLGTGIGSVVDSIPITGTFDVQTSGTGVQLTSNAGYGPYQQLSGLGNGGGGWMEFSNKPTVTLEEYSENATVFLDTTTAAPEERNFNLNMHEADDNTTIDMTPSNVVTNVTTNFAPVANNASVTVWGNADPVIINGNSSTEVSVGYPLGNGLDTTRGIKANVSVVGASSLSLSDDGNDLSHENVKVTNYTISGSGLFGSNAVTLFYGDVGSVGLLTGQLADTYDVLGSNFTSQINITDFSDDYFQTNVDVNSGSHLNLHLSNDTSHIARVVLNPSSGAAQTTTTGPESGSVKLFFGGTDESDVFFQGYVVALES
jgi:hypothetical protein